jgi:phage replication O-like protein O
MARTLIPNSTQIPDVILDHWIGVLSGAEFKVLLYVARRTYGFGKDADNISLNQIAAGMRRRDGTLLNRGTGLSRSGVKIACNLLIEKRILIRTSRTAKGSREPEESTYRLNLYAPLPVDDEPPSEPPEGVEEVGQNVAYLGQKKAYLGQKSTRGRPKSDREVGQKLALQETLQETHQETASARGGERDFPQRSKSLFPRGEAPLDAAALVEELVSHGVGRSTADRLAREKPDTCRRCLEYLPYAKFKTTKGAWLANAIRDEYGPPPGYEKARAQLAREQEARSRDLARNAQEKDELAIREQNAARVGSAYRQLEEMQGEAYAAFTEYVQRERARTDRIAQHLSPERRAELLAAFDRPERRLELFQAWMNSTSDFLPQ